MHFRFATLVMWKNVRHFKEYSGEKCEGIMETRCQEVQDRQCRNINFLLQFWSMKSYSVGTYYVLILARVIYVSYKINKT